MMMRLLHMHEIVVQMWFEMVVDDEEMHLKLAW